MRKGLEIAFFGSSLVSAYWNGAATYYRGIIRALHARGHRVTFYEPDAFERQKHRDMEPPSWAKVVVYTPSRDAALRQIEAAAGADVIIKASGVGVFDELLEAAVLTRKRYDNAVVFWDVDAPATLDRLGQNPKDAFHEKIPRYDLILTYGGGEPVRQAYKALGAKECFPIYNGLDPETHHPAPANRRYACTLSFLGNRLPDREARVEAFFLRAAEQLAEHSFLLGGNGWDDKALPANMRWIGHVPTAQHNAFNNSSLAVLNISRASMARYGFSPATRVFEAAGAGACLITDAWDGIETFFEPGRELLVAKDGNDVAEHVKALDAQRARRIGEAALQRVLAHHTYAQRVVELERLLEGIVP